MFRKRSGEGNKRNEQWHQWITFHRPTLASIGLAPEVYLDEGAWHDFLENGHLHWHPSSGFDCSKLSHEQQAELLRFLENDLLGSMEAPSLIGWLRVRMGREQGGQAGYPLADESTSFDIGSDPTDPH